LIVVIGPSLAGECRGSRSTAVEDVLGTLGGGRIGCNDPYCAEAEQERQESAALRTADDVG
jgi:hypothetical protein